MPRAPRFSVFVPCSAEVDPDAQAQTLNSVRAQTSGEWELTPIPTAGGIATALNTALADARGEFVVLLWPGDELAPRALAKVGEALRGEPEADFIYGDEERLDAGSRRARAFFKPDWAPERFLAQPYALGPSVLRRTVLIEAGGFDQEFAAALEWDAVLRVTERARTVLHVPEILYRRHRPAQPAADASDTGDRAATAHCGRIGLAAEVHRDPQTGIRHLRPKLDRRPPVSIVIPTGGRTREVRGDPVVLISHSLRSLVSTSTYETYEIVCVVDEGADPGLLDELRTIAGDRLRLVRCDGPFNFSAKVNLGAVHSSGEHLLLLNDDVEVVTPDWIERMLMYSSVEQIGAVGARLLWEDGRLQHVGVVFEDGLPGHLYHGFSAKFPGYAENVVVPQNYLAVTAACMMTRRDAFEVVGGFNQELPVNYNDADYCLKLRSRGLRVVYDPDTVLYHFESSSRSGVVEGEEAEKLLARWQPVTEADPFSNPNLRGGIPRLRSARAARKRARLR
jgi:O-antigen biosynthesis protein